MPRSESGRSGVPTRPSFRLSSYENEIRKRPYPFRWCGGSVRMHARLYPSCESFSFEKYPTGCSRSASFASCSSST